jgi:hypothetical protein
LSSFIVGKEFIASEVVVCLSFVKELLVQISEVASVLWLASVTVSVSSTAVNVSMGLGIFVVFI